MSKSETTSKRIASIAAKGLKRPDSLTLEEIKSVCASCLTQKDEKLVELLEENEQNGTN